jgi:hypothetical protein
MPKPLLILVLSLSIAFASHAQDYVSDLTLIKDQHGPEVKTKSGARFIYFTPPYWVYKFGEKMIIPQMAITERFEMKLGPFVKGAFKEFGPIKAYFMSIDRINRTGRLGYVDFPAVRLTPDRLIIDYPQYYRIK